MRAHARDVDGHANRPEPHVLRKACTVKSMTFLSGHARWSASRQDNRTPKACRWNRHTICARRFIRGDHALAASTSPSSPTCKCRQLPVAAPRVCAMGRILRRSVVELWDVFGPNMVCVFANNCLRDRFKVEDGSRIGRDELLSWACIRLDRLRPGYRYVRLMDTKGRPIKDGKLLVRIKKVHR